MNNPYICHVALLHPNAWPMAHAILSTDAVLDERTRCALRTLLEMNLKVTQASRLTELGLVFVAARAIDTDEARAYCAAVAAEVEAMQGDATNILTSVVSWLDDARHLGARHVVTH